MQVLFTHKTHTQNTHTKRVSYNKKIKWNQKVNERKTMVSYIIWSPFLIESFHQEDCTSPYYQWKWTTNCCLLCVEHVEKTINRHRVNITTKQDHWTWVMDELQKALEKGYVVQRIYEVWHFDAAEKYDSKTKTGGIFTDYVNTFLKIKQEASGWPEWCQSENH